MAIDALESREGRLAELLRLLMPFPGRLEFAVRLALICALTTLVVEIYQTPEPALTTYLVFFLNKPDRGSSLILNIAMLALFSLIVTSVILVTIIVIDQPVWRVASMAAISLGLLFLASASKLRPIGGTVALIVAYALDLLGTVHGGEIATRALLYVWLFVGIPAGVSIGVNLVLAPSPRLLAEQALGRRLRLAAAMLGTPSEGIRRDFTESVREGNGELRKWLKLALVEKSVARKHIEALRQAATSSFEILAMIDVMDRDVEAALPMPLRERLTLTLDAMARILDDGGYPIDIEFEDSADGEPSLPPCAAAILASIREALIAFAEAAPNAQPHGEAAPDTQPHGPAKKSGGFFLPDAFTNPEHVHYALKTTAAAMFCYVLYLLLDWPGIHTGLITCYIVSLGTTAETVEKLTLRILGCLVGAAVRHCGDRLSDPLHHFHRGSDDCCVPRRTRVGVGRGRQPTHCLCRVPDRLRLLSLRHPGLRALFRHDDGQGPGDRHFARQSSCLCHIRQYLAGERRKTHRSGDRRSPAAPERHSLTEVSKSARRSEAPELQEMLAGIERDLDLAPYEPRSIRPIDSWIEVRRRAADKLGALFGPLLLTADKDLRFSAPIANRLRRLADNLDALHEAHTSVADSLVASAEARKEDLESAQLPFHDAIVRRLNSLEKAFDLESESDRKANYASA